MNKKESVGPFYPTYSKEYRKEGLKLLCRKVLRPLSKWRIWENENGQWTAYPIAHFSECQVEKARQNKLIWPWPTKENHANELSKAGFRPAEYAENWQIVDAVYTETETSEDANSEDSDS